MLDVVLVIKTHSDYNYLWPIIDDYISSINIYKILLYNKDISSFDENNNLPKNFDKYIQYDESLNFNHRLLNSIIDIDTEFILFLPDVDIIVNLNIDILKIYVEIMKDNNIDRVNTAVFNGNNCFYKKEYGLCDLNYPLKENSNHFTPIDCHPTIWKKNSWIEILQKFKNNNYNSSDLDPNYIDYCKKNIKCFGIQKTNNFKIKYNRGLTNSEYLDWLHITTKSKFLTPFSCYHDYEIELKKIINKYNLNINKIGTCKAHSACMSFNKLK
jgi:hypothetical protein